MKRILIYFFIILGNISFSKMTIGITMLPYYSFAKNIVGDKMDLISIVPENINSHNYDPTPQDIKRLDKCDIVILNGIGHDEYVEKILKVSNNKKIKKIYANKNVIPMSSNEEEHCNHHDEKGHNHAINEHTFISVTQSIIQINYIAEELSKIDPKNRSVYKKNALEYTTKLRKMLLEYKLEIKDIDISKIKIATTHSAYDYLLAEFGLQVSLIVENSALHPLTAVDLKNAITKIKKEKINILFDEEKSNGKNAEIIKKQTGVYIGQLNHLTKGKYTKTIFENFISSNLDQIVKAIKKVSK